MPYLLTMSLKAIFFDNDGVLMNTERIVFEANRQGFARMGIDYTIADFHHTAFHTSKGSLGFLEDLGQIERKLEFETLRDEVWDPALKEGGHMIAGVADVLNQLKAAPYTLGLTTSAIREKFLMMSQDSNLYDYFDFHLFREDVIEVKPNPEMYLKALKKAGVTAKEALVIEDAPRGILAAKAAGIKVVAVYNEMLEGVDVSMADFHLTSIKELPELIESF